MLARGVLEEEEDGEQGDASEWQVTIPDMSGSEPRRLARYVHPKTPSPTRAIRQHPAENRPYDRRDAEHARQRCNIDGPFPQPYRIPHNRHASGEQRCCPRACDCSANNQHDGVLCCGADDGSQLKDEESDEVCPFDVEVGVDLAKGRLE